jgi:hypothetical protein
MEYKVDNFTTDNSIVYLGDSTEMLKKEPDDSVALTITSVPFPGMYTYTNSARDAGNCKSGEETTEHIKYIMEQVYRVTMPGRLCCIHLTQEPLFKWKDGHVGRLDSARFSRRHYPNDAGNGLGLLVGNIHCQESTNESNEDK